MKENIENKNNRKKYEKLKVTIWNSILNNEYEK